MEWTTQVLTSLLVFEISEFWGQLTLTQWHALCGKNMLFVVNTEHLHRNVPTLISNPFTKTVIPSLYIQQSLCMYTSTLHGWQNGCCEGKTTRYWSVCLVVSVWPILLKCGLPRPLTCCTTRGSTAGPACALVLLAALALKQPYSIIITLILDAGIQFWLEFPFWSLLRIHMRARWDFSCSSRGKMQNIMRNFKTPALPESAHHIFWKKKYLFQENSSSQVISIHFFFCSFSTAD